MTKNSETMACDNILRNDTSDLIIKFHMGNFSEPEEMNNTCMKTTYTGTTDRGFTA